MPVNNGRRRGMLNKSTDSKTILTSHSHRQLCNKLRPLKNWKCQAHGVTWFKRKAGDNTWPTVSTVCFEVGPTLQPANCTFLRSPAYIQAIAVIMKSEPRWQSRWALDSRPLLQASRALMRQTSFLPPSPLLPPVEGALRKQPQPTGTTARSKLKKLKTHQTWKDSSSVTSKPRGTSKHCGSRLGRGAGRKWSFPFYRWARGTARGCLK